MRKLLISATIAGCFAAPTSAAEARSLYDGSWNLVFVTQRGGCDPTYDFTVKLDSAAGASKDESSEHVVVLRVYDRYDNMSASKALIQAK